MRNERKEFNRREFFKLLIPTGLAALIWGIKAKSLLANNTSVNASAQANEPEPTPEPPVEPSPVPVAPIEITGNTHPEVSYWLGQPDNLTNYGRSFEPDFAPYIPATVSEWNKYMAAAIKWYNASHGLSPADTFAPQLAEITLILWLETCGVNRDSRSGARPPMGVMPFHFGETEDDRDMWVVLQKGVDYFGQQLSNAAGSGYTDLEAVLMAFAAYNGGPGIFTSTWYDETVRYYRLAAYAMRDPAHFAAEFNNAPGGTCQQAITNNGLAAWKDYESQKGISVP